MAAEHNEWFEKVKAERKAETKNVKAALIAAGYKKVRVGHGRGTAWGWMDVHVEFTGDYTENLHNIEAIAVKASGRTGRAAENISIHMERAEGDVAPEKKLLDKADGYKVSRKPTPEERLLNDIFPERVKKQNLLVMPSPSKMVN